VSATPKPLRDVLFDLDGTLLDPFEGITKCYQHALRSLGLPVPSQRELAWCIGPPLRGNLATLLRTDDPAAIERAVALFRERFDAVGWAETRWYDGAKALLEGLRAKGIRTHLATAKPLPFTERTVERFGLAPLLDSFHAAALDASRDDKAHVIEGLVASEGVDPARAVMVGDRAQDVRAARANAIHPIGVTYGYGSATELREAGAELLCDSPAAVLRAVLP
jgi:phosphoglycolate phosphatase